MSINRFQEAAVWVSGKFTVDSEGRVWRGSKRAENRVGEYLQVKVMANKKRYYTCAHRLVWHAINGSIPLGMVVNHKNGIKDDNRPSNLEIVTASENLKHSHRNGLSDQFGQRNPASKLTDRDIAKIRTIYAAGGHTMEQLGRMFGVRFQHISRIIRGQRRAKQGGIIQSKDLRHSVCIKDSKTGQFVGKKSAGRLLDGQEWNEFPNSNL